MTRTPTNFTVEEARATAVASVPLRCMRTALRVAITAAAVVLAGLILFPADAHAGRSCEQRKPRAETVALGMDMAATTSRRLDASGARVVLLARMGQDLSKYGVRYSHLAVAYRSEAGPWRVVHKLNECGTAHAAIHRQGLGEFFMDDPWRYEAAYAVPTPAVQARLLALLDEPPARIVRMHVEPYSLVSYAWGQRYQQSNQWLIETLAAAQEPDVIRSREQAQAWLRFRGYEPGVLKLGPLTRLGGRMTAANVVFDDHPNEKRFADRIETVTADSVFQWLARAGIAAASQIVQLAGANE